MPMTFTIPRFRSSSPVLSPLLVTIFSIQEITHFIIKLYVMIMVCILMIHHVMDLGLNESMVEYNAIQNTSKFFNGIGSKLIKICIMDIHIFLNLIKALFLSCLKSLTSASFCILILLFLNMLFSNIVIMVDSFSLEPSLEWVSYDVPYWDQNLFDQFL